MKISHRKAQAWLAEYAAGELGAREQQAVTSHLERCEVCQHNLAEIRHIRSMVRTLAVQPFAERSYAPLTNLEAIFASQESDRSTVGRQYRSTPEIVHAQRRPQRKLLSLLAAVLLALILVFGTVFVLNLELRVHGGPATQQRSTPTVLPHNACTTVTPPLATPTAAGAATPTPQTPLPTPTPTATPTQEGCPQSMMEKQGQ